MIYFDNAASSYPKPSAVYRSVGYWLRHNGANPGRSSHKPAIEASEVVFDTRLRICNMFCVSQPENIAFIPNATYGLNYIIQGILNSGDHVVTTDLEHNSVLRPLNLMRHKGVKFDVADVDLYDDNKTVENIIALINKNTKAVICTQCSNVCGKIMPIKKISQLLPKSIKFAVDGSQGAGVIPTNLSELGVSYYCAPSHKGLLGPQGSGFIAVLSDYPRALITGGTGSDSFNLNQPEEMPDLLESGTLATPVIKGMNEGLKFIESVGIEKIFNHKLKLTEYAFEKLKNIEGIHVYADVKRAQFVGVLCFNVKGKHSDDVAKFLADKNICVRSGTHCAPLFHKKIGTENIGAVRISFSYFNTLNEIDWFVKILNNYVKN